MLLIFKIKGPNMKIVIIGATGTIGKAVVAALSSEHELIKVAKSSGDYQTDISDENSVKALFEKIGAFDALVSVAGSIHFGPLKEFDQSKWQIGLKSKLLGQVNLVMQGLSYIRPNGSFTLTSGILSDDPILYGVSATMVNSAINGFVKAAAIELENGVRINSVSPTLLKESIKDYGSFFRGFIPVDAEIVAQAYIKSVEGRQTGQVYKVI